MHSSIASAALALAQMDTNRCSLAFFLLFVFTRVSFQSARKPQSTLRASLVTAPFLPPYDTLPSHPFALRVARLRETQDNIPPVSTISTFKGGGDIGTRNSRVLYPTKISRIELAMHALPYLSTVTIGIIATFLCRSHQLQ